MSETDKALNQPWVIIGHIRTPFKELDQLPIQGTAGDVAGKIELLPQYADGLCDLEGFDRIWLIYYAGPQQSAGLKIVPRLDDQPRGVFATRSFSRPNPIGLTTVKLLKITGCTLKVEGVDMFDGSPLLDIKPYVTRYDAYEDAWGGWLENRVPHEKAWRDRQKRKAK